MSKERQFKGLSLSERKEARREKLIEAGIATYGTLGFFSVTVKMSAKRQNSPNVIFMNHLKRVKIYSKPSFKMIEELQQNLMQAVIKAAPDPEKMVDGFKSTADDIKR